MAKTDYKAKAQGMLTTKDLVKQWAAIEAGVTPGWPKGLAFEYLVIRAFEYEGAEVRYPYRVPGENVDILEQIDGTVYALNTAFLVESKDFRKKRTTVEPIAKLRLRLERRPPSTIGILFSRQGLTVAALEVGLPRNILLWQGDEIAVAIRNQKMLEGLRIKLRHAIEDGVRDYNLLGEGWP